MKRLYVLFCTLVTLSVALLASCSSTQRISVKQEQEGQIQETVIESDTKVNSFSMVITNDRIEYNGSVAFSTKAEKLIPPLAKSTDSLGFRSPQKSGDFRGPHRKHRMSKVRPVRGLQAQATPQVDLVADSEIRQRCRG